MEFKDLEFHEEGHIYILNGCQLPSVTQLAHRFIREPFDEAFQAMRYAERHGETPELTKRFRRCDMQNVMGRLRNTG